MEIEIISVSRQETRHGDPMWVLVSKGGDKLFAFGNQMPQQPWANSGYVDWFTAMESGQTDRWDTHPIIMNITAGSQYPVIDSIAIRHDDERPDLFSAPHSALELYGPVVRRALVSWMLEPAVVFDTETTGVSAELDEIVSIATRELFPDTEQDEESLPPPPAAPLYSLVQPRNPDKLLYKSAKGTCAYDVHGIHPDALDDAPVFNAIYDDIYRALNWRHWIVWNADFDVPLLDSVCLRNGRPLIPRAGVWCAMKLIGPLAEDWDMRRGSYRWQKLGAMAEHIGVEFPDAHNAQADVDMTIRIIEWAQAELRQGA